MALRRRRPICNPSHRACYHLGTFFTLSHPSPGFVCPSHSLTQKFWVSVRGKVHNGLATALAWKELFTVPSQFLVFFIKVCLKLAQKPDTLTKTLISRDCFAFCNVCHNLKGMHVGSQKVWESTHTASYHIFRQEFCGFQPVWKNKTSLVFSSYAQPDFNILKLNPYFNIPGSDSHFISVHDLRSVDRKNSNFHLHLIYFISTNPSVDRKNSNFYSYFTYSINTNRIYLRRSNYLQPAPTMHPWERWASRTRKLLRIITMIKQFSEKKRHWTWSIQSWCTKTT